MAHVALRGVLEQASCHACQVTLQLSSPAKMAYLGTRGNFEEAVEKVAPVALRGVLEQASCHACKSPLQLSSPAKVAYLGTRGGVEEAGEQVAHIALRGVLEQARLRIPGPAAEDVHLHACPTPSPVRCLAVPWSDEQLLVAWASSVVRSTSAGTGWLGRHLQPAEC